MRSKDYILNYLKINILGSGVSNFSLLLVLSPNDLMWLPRSTYFCVFFLLPPLSLPLLYLNGEFKGGGSPVLKGGALREG
ncbi:hypothetical protein [Sulfuracidifex metallicus]|uniref:hypothetical protein n=1 Tax=Sulfuracidifex metallicus TaxID=47303 RepID=UPI0022745F56|nr:hypothetical protein [Sulfuracidifex metallicus]MCY0849217.1 hypothetical protein [Sulfuracidifex metallicus]